MKKFLFAALLALPALGLAIDEASASWNICGQSSCSYSFCGPRVWCGFDWGAPSCPAPYAHPYSAPAPAAPAIPAAPTLPAPTLKPEAALAIPGTQPAAYQYSTPGYYNPYANGGYAVPSYWYGR